VFDSSWLERLFICCHMPCYSCTCSSKTEWSQRDRRWQAERYTHANLHCEEEAIRRLRQSF
jgi:hypothetical protein